MFLKIGYMSHGNGDKTLTYNVKYRKSVIILILKIYDVETIKIACEGTLSSNLVIIASHIPSRRPYFQEMTHEAKTTVSY